MKTQFIAEAEQAGLENVVNSKESKKVMVIMDALHYIKQNIGNISQGEKDTIELLLEHGNRAIKYISTTGDEDMGDYKQEVIEYIDGLKKAFASKIKCLEIAKSKIK